MEGDARRGRRVVAMPVRRGYRPVGRAGSRVGGLRVVTTAGLSGQAPAESLSQREADDREGRLWRSQWLDPGGSDRAADRLAVPPQVPASGCDPGAVHRPGWLRSDVRDRPRAVDY